MADIYRKAALERLSSPEQLDKIMTVSRPVSWLALLGVTIVITAAVLWSVFGTLPTTISVQGLVGSDSESSGYQLVRCYAPYSSLGEIETGMRAVVYSQTDDSRLSAEVISVSLNDADISAFEIIFGSDETPVEVLLRLTTETLQERTLVTARIITNESAPIKRLMVP